MADGHAYVSLRHHYVFMPERGINILRLYNVCLVTDVCLERRKIAHSIALGKTHASSLLGTFKEKLSSCKE